MNDTKKPYSNLSLVFRDAAALVLKRGSPPTGASPTPSATPVPNAPPTPSASPVPNAPPTPSASPVPNAPLIAKALPTPSGMESNTQLTTPAVDLLVPADRFVSVSRLYGRLHRWQLLLGRYWWVISLIVVV